MDRSLDAFVEVQKLNWDVAFAANRRALQDGAGTGQIARFAGVRDQRGRGLSAIFQGLCFLIPAVLASPVGRELHSLARNVVRDVRAGERLMPSLKRHGRQSVRNLVGVGVRRLRRRHARVTTTKQRRRRHSKAPHARPLAISRKRAFGERSPLFVRANAPPPPPTRK